MSRRILGPLHCGVLIAGGLALGFASVAEAQLRPGSQQGLGLTGASIPPLLQQIRTDPYRMPAEPVCASIAQEMSQLDAIMGPDVDKLKTDRSVADRAAGYVRGMIPYHGVVRFLTGADGKDRELQAAASAGYARRGFLHGLRAQHHCDGAAETRIAAADPAPYAAVAVAPAKARDADIQGVDASARVPEADAPAAAADARLKVLAAAPQPPDSSAGERLTAGMPERPAAAPPPHVVYRLVDATTGQAIVPDGEPRR